MNPVPDSRFTPLLDSLVSTTDGSLRFTLSFTFGNHLALVVALPTTGNSQLDFRKAILEIQR